MEDSTCHYNPQVWKELPGSANPGRSGKDSQLMGSHPLPQVFGLQQAETEGLKENQSKFESQVKPIECGIHCTFFTVDGVAHSN